MTVEETKHKYLQIAGYHVREMQIKILDYIQSNDLPYKLNFEFDTKHKNWKYVEKVHLR